MQISFWKDKDDAFPFTFAANYIVAIQVVLYVNGAGEGAHDVIVHANGGTFRFPYIGRNISAKLNWEMWLEGQR